MDTQDWPSKREGEPVNVTLQPMATSAMLALMIVMIRWHSPHSYPIDKNPLLMFVFLRGFGVSWIRLTHHT